MAAARQDGLSNRLAVYEPPFILDNSHRPDDPGFTDALRDLLANGHRTRAVQKFLRLLGVPAPVVLVMPVLPVWKKLTASADTVPNDFEIVSPFRRGLPLPEGYYGAISIPTLLIVGGKSPNHMRHVPLAIAQIPRADTTVLKG